MTRRTFLSILPAAALSRPPQGPVIVPVHVVIDRLARWRSTDIGHFWSTIWPEALRDLERCGVRLQSVVKVGEVGRPHGREPVITGLDAGVVNLVVTDQIPVQWDRGRALSGVTTRYRGFHLCMVALNHAHGHQVPLLSVNTCVHELLHALLLDIFESRPKGFAGETREFRIDCYATGLWIFHDGAAIRQSAQGYVERLRADVHAAGN
jgi:hypothetical protein